MKINSFVCGAAIVAALFASAHLAGACTVDLSVDLGCGFHSMTDVSGVSVHDGGGDGYDCADGYLAETGGGTITLAVDLPAGTFYVGGTAGPGDIYGPAATVEVTDGSSPIDQSNGIVGPTTVYVSFLNAGSAITRAASISVTGEADDASTVCAELNCDFTSVTDCWGITIWGGPGDKGDCADGYLANTGGGTVSVEVDLPSGTFDVSGTAGPGDIYGPAASVDINDGSTSISGTGIVGPTTVYVLFLNQGSAITRAAEVCVSRY